MEICSWQFCGTRSIVMFFFFFFFFFQVSQGEYEYAVLSIVSIDENCSVLVVQL